MVERRFRRSTDEPAAEEESAESLLKKKLKSQPKRLVAQQAKKKQQKLSKKHFQKMQRTQKKQMLFQPLLKVGKSCGPLSGLLLSLRKPKDGALETTVFSSDLQVSPCTNSPEVEQRRRP